MSHGVAPADPDLDVWERAEVQRLLMYAAYMSSGGEGRLDSNS